MRKRPASVHPTAAPLVPPSVETAPAEDPGPPRVARSFLPRRGLQTLVPWEAANFNPEDTGEWGGAAQAEHVHARRGRQLAAIGFLMALPLIAVVIWQTIRHDEIRAVSKVPSDSASKSPPAADVARRMADRATAFLATTTVADRAAFVRHPEVTRKRMEAWYTLHNPIRPLKVLQFHNRSVEQSVGGHTFLMLYMDLEDFSTRAIAVEEMPNGALEIDWESFESWSSAPWAEFIATEPAGSVDFRVVAERDSYYNFGYADPEQWACFKLTDPDDQRHCWAYCAVNSEADRALEHLLRRQRRYGQFQIKAIVRLRFEDGRLGHHQALVESVVQDGWLKPDP